MKGQASLLNFYSKINVTEGCWYWTGHVQRRGYGVLSYKNKLYTAQRFCYQIMYGYIPEGIVVDHECHNLDMSCVAGDKCMHRRCVNPLHLSLKTIKDNLYSSRNSIHSQSKLMKKCLYGHDFSGANIYTSGAGYRSCLKCRTLRNRQRYSKEVT